MPLFAKQITDKVVVVCVRCNIAAVVGRYSHTFILDSHSLRQCVVQESDLSQSKKCIASSENELSPSVCTLNNVIGSFEKVQIRWKLEVYL